MNFEQLNFFVVAIGIALTVIINWDRLQSAPSWLISFVIGAASGFVAGYLF